VIDVKNLLFQPLTFHLVGTEENLHLAPRERRRIPKAQVSKELELAGRRGVVSLTPVEEPAKAAKDKDTAKPGRKRRKPSTTGKEA